MRDRSYDDGMAGYYRERPERALAVLNEILQDGAPGELQVTLRQMKKAFGGPEEDSKQANGTVPIDAEPTLDTLRANLKGMGLRLRVESAGLAERPSETGHPRAVEAKQAATA